LKLSPSAVSAAAKARPSIACIAEVWSIHGETDAPRAELLLKDINKKDEFNFRKGKMDHEFYNVMCCYGSLRSSTNEKFMAQ
jgi:hypothetical protein